eukprot:293180-Prorocentrum_lima.AAC.1
MFCGVDTRLSRPPLGPLPEAGELTPGGGVLALPPVPSGPFPPPLLACLPAFPPSCFLPPWVGLGWWGLPPASGSWDSSWVSGGCRVGPPSLAPRVSPGPSPPWGLPPGPPRPAPFLSLLPS